MVRTYCTFYTQFGSSQPQKQLFTVMVMAALQPQYHTEPEVSLLEA